MGLGAIDWLVILAKDEARRLCQGQAPYEVPTLQESIADESRGHR